MPEGNANVAALGHVNCQTLSLALLALVWGRWAMAKGADTEMRITLGTAVFSGMLGVTIFGIFLTPMFYYVIDWLTKPSRPALPKTKPGSRSSDSRPCRRVARRPPAGMPE